MAHFRFYQSTALPFHGIEVMSDKLTSFPESTAHALRSEIESVYILRALYRGTSAFLTEVDPDPIQPDLLGEHVKLEHVERVHQGIDEFIVNTASTSSASARATKRCSV